MTELKIVVGAVAIVFILWVMYSAPPTNPPGE